MLKRMLRELADEGKVERRRKKLHQPGTLPNVVVADITTRDTDGELIAVPTEWDEAEHGPAPKIRLHIPRRARPNEIAGVGDRALLRVEEAGEKDEAIRHSGRVIKLIDRAKQRVLGIFRARPDGGGRLEPIDKKQIGRELTIPPGAGADAQDGDLVAVEVAASRSGYGLATARVKEKLGSLATERAVSLIAIHAHSIPHVFPAAALAEAEAAKPATLAEPRGLAQACRSSPSILPTPRTTTTPCTPCATTIRRIPAASCSASPSPTSPTTCGPAPRSTARRSCAATRSTFPIASCRCCRSASPTTCARCGPARIAPRWPCASSSVPTDASVPTASIAC